MNNQFFSKEQLKKAVNEYLDLDNQISTLQKAIKERKDKKQISNHELHKFISKFFPASDATVFKTLKLVFKVNSLLYRANINNFEVGNTEYFFNLIKDIYKKGIVLNDLFKIINKKQDPSLDFF